MNNVLTAQYVLPPSLPSPTPPLPQKKTESDSFSWGKLSVTELRYPTYWFLTVFGFSTDCCQVSFFVHFSGFFNMCFSASLGTFFIISFEQHAHCALYRNLPADIQPSSEVLEQCTAFLLNIRDWEYLSNLENTANGYIEVRQNG